jgi:hypothetical protein
LQIADQGGLRTPDIGESNDRFADQGGLRTPDIGESIDSYKAEPNVGFHDPGLRIYQNQWTVIRQNQM